MVVLEGSRVLRRSPDVVCRQVGPESILVPVRGNVGNLDFVYTLSPVAAKVWSLLDGSRSLDAVIDAVCDEYDVDRETAWRDVTELLSSLQEAKLIAESRA
jgi:hypothetical protein